jgi:hypothetical protein
MHGIKEDDLKVYVVESVWILRDRRSDQDAEITALQSLVRLHINLKNPRCFLHDIGSYLFRKPTYRISMV